VARKQEAKVVESPMKAQKVVVTVRVEVLAVEVAPAMICKAMQQMADEVQEGKLVMADGDTVEWDTVHNDVEF
jgi:hypothetical protein